MAAFLICAIGASTASVCSTLQWSYDLLLRLARSRTYKHQPSPFSLLDDLDQGFLGARQAAIDSCS